MANQKMRKTAKIKGLYSCTNLYETIFMHAGEEFPNCSCTPPGEWELLKEKNINKENAIILFIGKGIIHAIETDELPEIGAHLNIRQARKGMGLNTGEHKIIKIDEKFMWMNKEQIRIMVERIGDLSDYLPIHQAAMLSI